jgi:hypothetical protein
MLRPKPLDPVPAETVRVAQAAFPKGHPYLRIADEIDDCTAPLSLDTNRVLVSQ